MFIYCFDKDTRDWLARYGFSQMNPDAPPPYIFANQSTIDLEAIEVLKGRYVLTNEMLYFT